MQIEGQFNYLLDQAGLLPEDIKRLSEIRFFACTRCEHTPHPCNSRINGPGLQADNRCSRTLRNVLFHSKAIEAKCPIGRW